MEENKLVVKNMDGNEITINVIDILENTDNNKQFICYTIEGIDGETFISTLDEKEDSYSLGDVTEEEKNEIEELMNQKDGE